VKPGYLPITLLSPGAAVLAQSTLGVSDFGDIGEPHPYGAARNLYEGIPAYLLAQRMRGHTSKTYPMTPREALLQYLLGGVAPRTTNRAVLNKNAARENSP
jgi:hypothetical protein